MKKALALIVAFILLFAGVYTLVDILTSFWLVLKYESFNAWTTGAITGKVLFLLVVSGLLLLVRRMYNKLK
ncbi:hypothetical protein [Phytobacter sp. V91]|uniref:hypothetical protein n=1 Tax=Phytobacter sp. V91 TaxID=3369425 RepID=UPI003F62C1E4